MLKSEQKIKIPLSKEQIELTEKMRKAVIDSSIKAVSFKLFGTLILPPFSEEEDLFYLMDREFPDISTEKSTFSQLRILAEEEAENDKGRKCSPTLDMIYEIIAKFSGIDEETRERAKKRECELLEKLYFPRNFGKMLFSEAADHKKKLIITADTVYPRNIVQRLLENCGYSGKFTLLISNELDSAETKNRTIYGKIAAKAGCSAGKLLHIGGDVEADVETPIMNGSKALLMTEVSLSLVRSGRLYGFLRSERVYDYDSPVCLALHGLLGLYSDYLFDIPRQKLPHSDFCGSLYGMGAIIYGAVMLDKEHSVGEGIQKRIAELMEENDEMKRGGEDMASLFGSHLGGFAEAFAFDSFDLPLKFLTAHGAPVDRQIFAAGLTEQEQKTWADSITEAEAAAIRDRKTKKNAASRLADKMFPPGSKVRNIADNMLMKLKGKSKL